MKNVIRIMVLVLLVVMAMAQKRAVRDPVSVPDREFQKQELITKDDEILLSCMVPCVLEWEILDGDSPGEFRYIVDHGEAVLDPYRVIWIEPAAIDMSTFGTLRVNVYRTLSPSQWGGLVKEEPIPEKLLLRVINYAH